MKLKLLSRYAYAGQFALENLLPGLRGQSIGSNLSTIDFSGVTTMSLPSGTTIGGSAVVALATITSTSANALTVGPAGATNPSFNVDASTASAATGLNVKSAAAAGGLAVSVISSGTNENLTVDAKGAGEIYLGKTSTGLTYLGGASAQQPVILGAATAIATQNGTPTAAQLLGGYINHASTTGAGTLTTPTGTQISTAIPGVAVGAKFDCLYYNSGTQTVTITAGASGITIVGGTAAVTTGKVVKMTFINTAANTWLLFLTTLF